MKSLLLRYFNLNLRVKDSNLQIWGNNQLVAELVPRDEHCPKLIVIEAVRYGSISLESEYWMASNGITLVRLDWDSSPLYEILPLQFGNFSEVKLAQYYCWLNHRLEVAKFFVEAKTGQQIPNHIDTITKLLMYEAKKAVGNNRKGDDNQNLNFPRGCMENYLFKILQSIVLSKIVASGLEPSLAFLHYNKTPIGLVFDCMEPFRRWVAEVVASIHTTSRDFERWKELNYVLRCKPELRKRLVAQFGWYLEQDETYHSERWKREALIYKFVQDLSRYLVKVFKESKQGSAHHKRAESVYQLAFEARK